IVVVAVNDVLLSDLRVDCRELLERVDCGLDEEGHKTKLHVVLFEELVLVLFTYSHDVRHVHLVEGGQHRSRLLSLNQAFGNLRTTRTHCTDFFVSITCGRPGYSCALASTAARDTGVSSATALRLRTFSGKGTGDVLLDHATPGSCVRHLVSG